MNTLINVPENGSLSNKNADSNFPKWSNWIDDFIQKDIKTSYNTNYSKGNLPKVNVKESPDCYLVEMAAPGMNKTDFEINLENKILTISSSTEKKKIEDNEHYTRKEFGYSVFKRSFNIPDSIDENKIEAKYKDGILNVYLPKKEEAKPKPSKIIKVS